MSRSGRRVASMVLVTATGSPSVARTARPDSAGTIVTRVMPTSTAPKTFSSVVTLSSEPRARTA